jgi:hypothetical protein
MSIQFSQYSKSLLVRIFLLVLLGSAAAVVYAATSVTLNESGSIDAAGQTQLGRIFRDGIPSTCGNKAYPGIFSVGTNFGYTVHGPYGPLTQDTCITINFDVGTCGTDGHAIAYLGGYDPNNQAAGFLGDVGSSVSQPFMFTVPAGQSFSIVVTNTSSLVSCDYSFASSTFMIEGTYTRPQLECSVIDGRINNKRGMDCAAPIIIFAPSEPASIDIYSFDPATGSSYMEIRMTMEEVEAIGVPTDAHRLLAQATNRYTGQSISLYRLTTGELQVNAFYADGKPYVVAWPADLPGALYHLES